MTDTNEKLYEKAREAMGLINRLLNAGHEVRLKHYYVHRCTHIICDGDVLDSIEDVILYPGYLNLTKAGTPARVEYLEDCGGFGSPNLSGVRAYRCEMRHKYNEHDKENWFDPEEGNEDLQLVYDK